MARILLLLTCLFTSATQAAIISVGAFTGALQESWENVSDPLSNGDSIFGGAAIFESTSGFPDKVPNGGFGLGDFGPAQTYDGTYYLGINGVNETTDFTFSFANGLSRFGGYWAAARSGTSITPDITFKAYDLANNLMGTLVNVYDGDTHGGDMTWFGFESTGAAIHKIEMFGDYYVADFQQADLAAVPAPSALILFGMGLLGFGLRRKS